jgi:hypothetical protein
LALEAAVAKLGYGSDCRHLSIPFSLSPEGISGSTRIGNGRGKERLNRMAEAPAEDLSVVLI